MDELRVIGRRARLFDRDVAKWESALEGMVSESSFLVVGGGGSIGRAVAKEIFKRGARTLHVVDISEHGLVELVRDVRSDFGYVTKDFDTFVIDASGDYFTSFFESGQYDYVLNLAALKHVRSEANIHTLKRMLDVNVLMPYRLLKLCIASQAKKYFCVSTDKATDPVNFMGASKRAMEICLMSGTDMAVSSARFANVAFSQGSLLDGFKYRLEKGQPLSLPADVERFFITSEEAGLLCLFSTLLCKHGETLIPNSPEEITLTPFTSIAERFLRDHGFSPHYCDSEEEARSYAQLNKANGNPRKQWPVYQFSSSTSGEKLFEEFFTESEELVSGQFEEAQSVMFTGQSVGSDVEGFLAQLQALASHDTSTISDYRSALSAFLGNFDHIDTGSFLNSRM